MLAFNIHEVFTSFTSGKTFTFEVNAWSEKASLYEIKGFKKEYVFKNIPINDFTFFDYEVAKEVEEIQKIKKNSGYLRGLAWATLGEVLGFGAYNGAVIGTLSAKDKIKIKRNYTTFVALGVKWKENGEIKDWVGAFDYKKDNEKALKTNLGALKNTLIKRNKI